MTRRPIERGSTELATGAGIAPDTIVEQRLLARMHVAWTVPTAASRRAARDDPTRQVPRHDRVFVAGDWVGPEGLLADAAITSGAAAATAARSCVTPRRRGTLRRVQNRWRMQCRLSTSSKRSARGCSGSPTASSVRPSTPKTSCRTRGCGGRQPTDIERPAAWLTTVVSRLALDAWRAQQRKREDYVGPWLPEPVATEAGPAERAELADSLTFGFLVLLDELSAVERVVFLLADVFGESYTDISATVGKIRSRVLARSRPGRGASCSSRSPTAR